MASFFTLVLSFAFAISCSSASTIFNRGSTDALQHQGVINGTIPLGGSILIVLVNGKWFVGYRTRMRWHEAKAFCEVKMKFASIDTQEEADALSWAWQEHMFDGTFHIYADNVGQPPQFSLQDGTQPSFRSEALQGGDITDEKCPLYYSSRESPDVYYSDCNFPRFIMCSAGAF